jgi:tRNA threonylcarbamoyl adenosine modification protein YeaZ
VLILGIDTSVRQGSVALLRGLESGTAAAAKAEAIELVSLAEGQASEVLVPAIDALLARHGVAKNSLALVGVASGPGSFTGLRVALATAKGLAEAFGIPVNAVSVLEAVALRGLLRRISAGPHRAGAPGAGGDCAARRLCLGAALNAGRLTGGLPNAAMCPGAGVHAG